MVYRPRNYLIINFTICEVTGMHNCTAFTCSVNFIPVPPKLAKVIKTMRKNGVDWQPSPNTRLCFARFAHHSTRCSEQNVSAQTSNHEEKQASLMTSNNFSCLWGGWTCLVTILYSLHSTVHCLNSNSLGPRLGLNVNQNHSKNVCADVSNGLTFQMKSSLTKSGGYAINIPVSNSCTRIQIGTNKRPLKFESYMCECLRGSFKSASFHTFKI